MSKSLAGVAGGVPVGGLSASVSMSPRSKLLVEASSSPKIKGGRNGGPTSTEGSPEFNFWFVGAKGETLFVFWMPWWSGRDDFERGSLGMSILEWSCTGGLPPG
jgi:hypothetical protein